MIMKDYIMPQKVKKPLKKDLCDVAGNPIRVGDTVKQSAANGRPWVNPERGALWVNAGQTGTVTALGRTRVVVDFGRTKRDVFGTVYTDEPVLDRVQAGMLLVVATEAAQP